MSSMNEETRPTQRTVGEAARLTGLPVKRIHYYERRGLLEPPPRSEAGYRLYGDEEIARLGFVKRAKLLGLTLEEIRELVSLAVVCDEGQIVPRLEEALDAKLQETERKIAEMSAFREDLRYYRRRAEELRTGMPLESTCEDASFCGCLDAVTGAEGGEYEDER